MTRWLRAGIVILVSVGGIVVLLFWLAGGFTSKIEPGPTEVGRRPLGGASTIEVRLTKIPLSEEALGTIGAAHETAVGAKIMARVLTVHAQAGQHVSKDQLLVELDKGDLEARLSQARAAEDSTKAALDQSQVNYDRIVGLREQNAASEYEFTSAENQLNASKANYEQARSAVREAEAVLQYATICSPLDAVVIDKTIDVGDMVTPGQTVFRLYDQLQMVATVRESLATRLEIGQSLPVALEALDLHCSGTVSEIVPEADVLSRAFHVKVTGSCPAGVIPGMFGRLYIPLGEREELQIPLTAVRWVGQVPYVYRVVRENEIERTFIQLADVHEDRVTVTSGLSVGERIVADQGGL